MKCTALRRPFDALAFSGLWAGAVAASLVLATGLVVTPELEPGMLACAMALALSGTLVVYNVDRLRDVEGDRLTAPLRSRFIEAHRSSVVVATGLAGIASVLLASLLPVSAWLACAAVLAVGLLHRRLKRYQRWKLAYVSLAWLAIVVGLPALCAQPGQLELASLLVAAAVLAPTIGANLIASDLRGLDRGSTSARRLRSARLLAAAGVAVALAASEARASALAALPAALLASLATFRPSERYCLVVLDGSLLVGSLAAVAAMLRLAC